MKSCRCAQCNVLSARYAWGFALLARDGWAYSDGSGLTGSLEEAWLCPACSERAGSTHPYLAKFGGDAGAASASRRSRSRNKLRVLLVDDEDMVRRCTTRTLADFEVVPVSGAVEAREFLKDDSDFDVVLSDVMMPRMSGPQLYAHCFEMHPTLARRFVFASGNPEAARVELSAAVQRVGAEHLPILLAKPSSREVLVLALYAAAASSAPPSGVWSVDETACEVTTYRG